MPLTQARQGQLLSSGPYQVPGLPEAHRVTAYLPAGHAEPGRAYSLAIFFDGQNLFEDAGSFRGGWHLNRLLDAREAHGARVPVVVAIHTDGGSRSAILSPWSEDPAQPALGDRFLDWVAGPLIRAVREEAGLRTAPEHTLIGGASLGGLLALYAFFRHPDVFGRVLAMSPTLGISNGKPGPIYPFVAQARRGPGRIYLDAGGRECPCGHVLTHAEAMAEVLAQKGFEPGRQLRWHPDPDGDHDEFHWRKRLPAAVDFLCGD